MADFDNADADLYLYDEDDNIVDMSIRTGELESILVTDDGTYRVNAQAFSGATNYILAIGAPDATGPTSAVAADFVPWQAIVRYRDEESGLSLASRGADIGMQTRAGGRGRARLMAMERAAPSVQQRRNSLGKSAASKGDAMTSATLRAQWETLITIKKLQQNPDVLYAHPNYRVQALATPNDDLFPLQWHYPLISLPEAWDTTTGSASVIIAVIDTGVLRTHPDLAGQLVSGYDFVSDEDASGDGDGIDPNPSDPGSAFGGGTGSFHGTHVSGIVAARGDNDIGGAGTAYGSRIMPLRALGVDGSGTSYDVLQAVRYAAGLSNDSPSVPDRSADIINMSLGGGLPTDAEQDLYQQVREMGIVVVAAAGNQASNQASYPAAYDGVVSVSAVDTQRNLAPYSNIGATIDVAAPGGNNGIDLTGDGFPDGVLSTSGDNSGNNLDFVFSFLNGTSMAAPHVAGVFALMKSINPDLSPDDIDALLGSGAITEDLGSVGRDNQFGHGLINAQLAVLAALDSLGNSPADNPRLVASGTTLNFGASTTSLGVTLRNGGTGELTISDIEISDDWLSFTPVAVDAAGLGDYRTGVVREELEAGVYSADITITSTVNTISLRVFASVGGAANTPDVGVIYCPAVRPRHQRDH